MGISTDVTLANGHKGFYLAVPVHAHRFSGDVSRAESRSAIVGLVDAQLLLAGGLSGAGSPGMSLRDGPVRLASFHPGFDNAVSTVISRPNRHWTVTVDGGAISALDRALPWLILAIGAGLALREALRRRDVALRMARERSAELERLSKEDPLTGIANRRHFGEILSERMEREMDDERLAVLMLDLDHFKPINDRYGHLTGDVVLQVTTKLIASVLREGDLLARWGGEEFAVLVPGTEAKGVRALAERARRAIAEEPIDVGGTLITLTLSVGIAIRSKDLDTPDSIVDAADQALYVEKDAGRDCVREWDPGAATLSAAPG